MAFISCRSILSYLLSIAFDIGLRAKKKKKKKTSSFATGSIYLQLSLDIRYTSYNNNSNSIKC